MEVDGSTINFDNFAAATAPWVAPDQCSEIWDMTTLRVAGGTAVPALWNDPLDERFESCTPKHRNNLAGEDIFVFAPAVCPDGWTTATMGTAALNTLGYGDTITVAVCCSR